MGTFVDQAYIDPLIVKQLEQVKHEVLHQDFDYVAVIDGERRTGKSVLAMQLAKFLDPGFHIGRIVYTADDFIKLIKDPSFPKGGAVILDESYSAANARNALSEVNRSMNTVANEMGQRNAFVFFVLPSFFDLDKTLAIHVTRSLFHVYLREEPNERKGVVEKVRGQYVVFTKDSKRKLYDKGKKSYDYNYPRADYGPLKYYNQYVIDEQQYRDLKKKAFDRREIGFGSKKWFNQRNSYMRYLYDRFKLTETEIAMVPKEYGFEALGQSAVSDVLNGKTRGSS
jgi:hypothetical protein